ncbi:MAG: ATP-binding cassette domain-containing protein [Firmicutes bacterium]|nr:ATP-binding cassette domain-containing protein [Bacillota bacterium]
MIEREISKVSVMKTENLTIKFGDFTANKDISIKFKAGEIHAVVGENGAGKSTLMKMLYGVYKPTSGKIYLDGCVRDITPSLAINSGICMVFQDFRLIPAFTVLENISLAMAESKEKRSELKKRIIEVSNKYNIPVDPDMYVWEMDLGQRQRVEILKGLMMPTSRMLIFDEPTSVLTQKEAEAFIELLKQLREDKYAIVLITHKLNEVISCADVITVLRRGEITDCMRKEDGFDKKRLIAKMMGEETAEKEVKYSEAHSEFNEEKAETNFSCENLSVIDDYGRKIIKNINLEIKKGEILGVAGISGRGQRELLETIFGIRKSGGGTITLDGKDITNASVAKRLEAGMSLISEDPKRDNVAGGMTIEEHMILGGIEVPQKGLGIDWESVHKTVEASPVVKRLGVPELDRTMATLSGGNIQRAVLARAIIKNPKLLLASYPSRGLDVGTVQMVHETLLEMRGKGESVLLISEDLDELFNISDRIIVIADNRIYGKYNPRETDSMRIGEIMLGGGKNAD